MLSNTYFPTQGGTISSVNKWNDIKILNITYQTDDRVKYLLNNIANEQNKDLQISHMKLSPLSSRYTIKNTIFYKLVNYDWKTVLSPEMLKTLTIPCHQSLAHATALKCHLALKEDFILIICLEE